MANIVVWGFCSESGEAIVAALKKEVDVPFWFGLHETSINIWDFLLGRCNELKYSPCAQSINRYQSFYESYFDTYTKMITRRGLHFKDVHELSNEFAGQFYYFYELLSSNKIDAIVFSNLPHEGPDFILYQVAKLLQIKAALCYQTIFPNHFFCTASMGDFGDFLDVKSLSSENKISFSETNAPLFYMKDVARKQAMNETASLSIKKAIGISYDLYLRLVRFVEKIPLRFETLTKNPSLKLSLFLRKKLYEKAYEKSVRESTVKDSYVDSLLSGNKKLIYFPLHLQPELTTSALGGIFQDQVYAIEKLSSLLNSEWMILVKDNPKQNFFQRGEGFYKRLSALENIKLVGAMYPSQKIIDQAEATATITGTAGWEAIKSGRKAIVFGDAWYQSLPNCLKIDKSSELSKVENFLDSAVTPLEEVAAAFDALMLKTYNGVVDAAYIQIVEDFNIDKNASEVSNSLLEVLKY